MIKKLLIIFTSLLIFNNIYSQERKPLYGIISDSLDVINNVHIINIQSNIATATIIDGTFKTFAKVGDTLKITSIQHQTKKYIVKKTSFGFNQLKIYLQPKIYELDEFEIKKHNLNSVLTSDVDKTPINKNHERVKNMVNEIKRMDFSRPIIEKLDFIESNVKPTKVTVDPIQKVLENGLFFGTKQSLSNGKNSKEYWDLRKELKFKKNFPKKLLTELGNSFFYKDLKIPKEKYYHFIEYCNLKEIEELYKKNELLKVIKILQEESISYLKIIKKD
ncbi:hypothetical protein OD91_2704 [Lutibacter sp. Hel_I_33_5]|uniref:hypothetical protein n=1 Tax=Lutibacter sp. Hel_I_33_5 TaxID=1566289 RepID=UPI0011A55A15|nr:hypothetical protein [Lutibacter sp. Hel_I_33_5]TVZ57383.1 hypothetical protein OD91_2704 [Lutibacter sp. Hel_I_33_5]